MKQVHATYSFVASTKTITLTGLNIDQDQLLLIVNATRGVQYFNFADSSLRGTVTSGANTTIVLTDASTTGHSNSDALVIYYDDQASTQAVSGTVTANPGTGAFTVSGTVGLDANSLSALENITVTVGAAVSVSNFPATQTVAGTVTANVLGLDYANGVTALLTLTICNNGIGSSDTAVAVMIASESGGVSQANPLPISGTVTVGNSVTIGSLPAISGTVTVGAMPNGSLTTRFGTPTTANTAFATSAVTNASRKYLLIQNVTTGSNVITVGIGFTPTTTQGIQLTAGAGITFESSYIPTGAVMILSSVTASNFTVLEA